MGIIDLGKVRGTQIYTGDKISGNNENETSFPESGIEKAYEGDVYINLDDSSNSKGNIYRCMVPGAPDVAKWIFEGKIGGSKTSTENTLQIDETLKDNTKAAPAGVVGELKGDLAHKLDKPATAQVGQIFRVQAINEDGTYVLEAVDMPVGSSVDSDQDYWATRDITIPDFEVNLEEDAAYLFIDRINGEPFEWEECVILANISSYVTGTVASGASFSLQSEEGIEKTSSLKTGTYMPTKNGYYYMLLHKNLGKYCLDYFTATLSNWSNGQTNINRTVKGLFGYPINFRDTIKSLCINFGTSVGLPAGMRIRIYGKPVKGADA